MAAMATGSAYADPFLNDGTPFKANFAPHYSLLPTGPKDFIDRMKFAYDLGFRAWEENGLLKEKYSIKKKYSGFVERIGTFARKKGITLGVTVITNGKGVKFFDPGEDGTKHILADMKKGVEHCKKTGQTNMTMIPGPRIEGMALKKQLEQSVDLMKRCCDVVEKQGIILALEPLSHDVKGGPPLLRSFSNGHRLCKLVNRKSCKLLADFYHEGEIGNGPTLVENGQAVWNQVSYVQYGASPGRKEPGTGKLDYVAVTKWLRKQGFTGIIGMEHGTKRKGAAGLKDLLAAYRKIDA